MASARERVSAFFRRELLGQLGAPERQTFEAAVLKLERLQDLVAWSGELAAVIGRQLKSRDRWVRERTASALAEIGGNRLCLPFLIASLKDGNPAVRDYACQALGKGKLKRALPYLRKALKDKDEQVRFSALEAVRSADSKAARVAARALLKDDSSVVRQGAVRVLAAGPLDGKAPGPRVLDILRRHLRRERHPLVRCEALEALYSRGHSESLRELLLLTNHGHGAVRWNAVEALRGLVSCGNRGEVARALRGCAESGRSARERLHAKAALREVERWLRP
jgi:HEAT repeat protein